MLTLIWLHFANVIKPYTQLSSNRSSYYKYSQVAEGRRAALIHLKMSSIINLYMDERFLCFGDFILLYAEEPEGYLKSPGFTNSACVVQEIQDF